MSTGNPQNPIVLLEEERQGFKVLAASLLRLKREGKTTDMPLQTIPKAVLTLLHAAGCSLGYAESVFRSEGFDLALYKTGQEKPKQPTGIETVFEYEGETKNSKRSIKSSKQVYRYY